MAWVAKDGDTPLTREEKVDRILSLQEEVEKALLERGVVEEALGGLLEQNNALLLKLDDAVQASLGPIPTDPVTNKPKAPSKLKDMSEAERDHVMFSGCFLAGASFLGQANSLLRKNYMHATLDQRKLILETSHFTSDEKAEIDYAFRSKSHLTQDAFNGELEKHFTGYTDTKRLSQLWTEVGDIKNQKFASVVEDITDAFESNKATVSDYMIKHKHEAADEATADVMANYGFSKFESEPYLFDEENRADNLVMEDGKAIKCATLNKLVEMVTHEKTVDLNTRYVFVLTYHSFTTASELLRKLAQRYKVPIPNNMTLEEIDMFKQGRVNRIQIRVCSVLKYWVDEHWSDFEKDEQLRNELKLTIDDFAKNSQSKMSAKLTMGLKSLVRKRESGSTERVIVATETKFPKPLINAKLTINTFTLEDANETEIARQLSLMDFDKFKQIQPRECLNQSWNKKRKHELAPNILGLIEQFNTVSGWVQFTIIDEPDLQKRAKLYAKFIRIAVECRALNNFNALFAIYCGLTANPIHRLRQTKSLIPSGLEKEMAQYKVLFRADKNSRNFRRALKQALTPCIPHLGLFLTDLTFTEDGNPDEIDNMINFDKRCKLAERIRWIKQYQQEGYQFTSVEVICQYLKRNLKVYDPEDLWQKSKVTEPRLPTNN